MIPYCYFILRCFGVAVAMIVMGGVFGELGLPPSMGALFLVGCVIWFNVRKY